MTRREVVAGFIPASPLVRTLVIEEEAGAGGGTISLSVDFAAPARSTGLRARAEVVRRGGRICFCEVTVAGDDGTVVAKGLMTHNYA